MMNLLGCTKENFYKLMIYMNYKKEKKKILILFMGEQKKKKSNLKIKNTKSI